jgi:hypothetical protein
MYSWRFKTSGFVVNPGTKPCYRGPMIDVELVMAQPYNRLTRFEGLRTRLLEVITEKGHLTEKTREVVLRVMNSLLAPLFVRLLPRKQELQALICTKRNCLSIESDLQGVNEEFNLALDWYPEQIALREQLVILRDALISRSPVVRVAGKSAVILLASYIEMDLTR